VLGFDRVKANRFAWNLKASQAMVVGQFEEYGFHRLLKNSFLPPEGMFL
jgi:hypothetical protein